MFTPTRSVRTVACFVLLPSTLLAGVVAGASSAAAHEPHTPASSESATFAYAEIIHALGDIPLAFYVARHEASRLVALV